jgi:hypothetical protein
MSPMNLEMIMFLNINKDLWESLRHFKFSLKKSPKIFFSFARVKIFFLKKQRQEL